MHQDTVGPMVRSVADAAAVLSIIAGPDPDDNYTLAQPLPVPEFTKALSKNALRGARIGIPRNIFMDQSVPGNRVDSYVNSIFEQAIRIVKELGATVIDPADLPSASRRRSFDEEVSH